MATIDIAMESTSQQIKTNTDTINTDVTAIKNNTATNNTASSTGLLSQKLSYIINKLNSSSSTGVVKSVTSGIASTSSGSSSATSGYYTDISVPNVNLNKSIIILDTALEFVGASGSVSGGTPSYDYAYAYGGVYLYSKTPGSNIFTVSSGSESYVKFSWQVIEFY